MRLLVSLAAATYLLKTLGPYGLRLAAFILECLASGQIVSWLFVLFISSLTVLCCWLAWRRIGGAVFHFVNEH